MTNKEFKNLLREVFNTYSFTNKRKYHTINELLYCLRYDARFKEFNPNISIAKANGEWCIIPIIDTFVDVNTLGIWFDDNNIKYEFEEFGKEKFDCITVYERN